MKKLAIMALFAAAIGCDKEPATTTQTTATTAPPTPAVVAPEPVAAPRVVDPNAPKNVVDVAVASKDHTTLVAALKAADYVDSLTNAGPFTVFAPTNAAFDKLPKGTVESLVTPEKKADLANILKYHVAVAVYQQKDLRDGMVLGMANPSARRARAAKEVRAPAGFAH